MLDKKEYYREYYKNNKEKYKQSIKKYQQSEKGKATIKEYRKEYDQRPDVKKRRSEFDKERYHKDPQNKTYRRINKQIRRCIMQYNRDGKITIRDVTFNAYNIIYGINLYELIDHLKPFPKDMENYDLDHVIPICKFDLNDINQLKKAYNKSNLQLIPSHKNKIKSKF